MEWRCFAQAQGWALAPSLIFCKTPVLCISSEVSQDENQTFSFTPFEAERSQQVSKGEFHEGRPSIEEQMLWCLSARGRTPFLVLRGL